MKYASTAISVVCVGMFLLYLWLTVVLPSLQTLAKLLAH